jgi:RecA-family ATPase
VGEDNLLIEFPNQYEGGRPTALYHRIRDQAIEIGAELVILDSLHDLFGGNENVRSHAREFVGELRQIAMETHGAVLLTAHPSVAGRNTGTGESGSTAWNNAVGSRLYLTEQKSDDTGTPGERDYRELKTMKSNYGPKGGSIRLKWVDGVFENAEPPTGIIATIGRRGAERVFLDLLKTNGGRPRRIAERPCAKLCAQTFCRAP